MHILVKAGAQPVILVNRPKTCGKIGVLVQSLDSNGQVYVGTDQQALSGSKDSFGNAPDGLLIGRSSAITNVPDVLPFVPFSGTLAAVNVGAADSVLAVTIFNLSD